MKVAKKNAPTSGLDKMPTWLGGEVRAQKERVEEKLEADCASHCNGGDVDPE
jgi:hypothetical protein